MNTLNNLLNNILKNEGLNCKAVEGDEFAYYYATSEAVYTLNDDEDMANAFYNFALANGLNKEVSVFAISFFHEVGHNETLDEVEEEFDGNKDNLRLEEYFNLEEEFLATEWAINFCNSHLDLMKEIEKFF